MKKVICLILALSLMIIFCACGEENKKDDNSSGYVADRGTIETVNNAYAATATATKNATAIGIISNLKRSVTVNDITESIRLTGKGTLMKSEDDMVMAIETELKSGDQSMLVKYYDDSKNVYGHVAGATFMLSEGEKTDAFAKGLYEDLEYFVDVSSIKVLDTVIVNTASGGYGFTLEYDLNDKSFDPAAIFTEMMVPEIAQGIELKPQGLRVSGIIDSEGKLTQQKIVYTYSYTFEVEEFNPDVDPDNSDAQTTIKVQKTANVELSVDYTINYDVIEVKIPEGITVLAEGEKIEDSETITEISVVDFDKLLNGFEEDE